MLIAASVMGVVVICLLACARAALSGEWWTHNIVRWDAVYRQQSSRKYSRSRQQCQGFCGAWGELCAGLLSIDSCIVYTLTLMHDIDVWQHNRVTCATRAQFWH